MANLRILWGSLPVEVRRPLFDRMPYGYDAAGAECPETSNCRISQTGGEGSHAEARRKLPAMQRRDGEWAMPHSSRIRGESHGLHHHALPNSWQPLPATGPRECRILSRSDLESWSAPSRRRTRSGRSGLCPPPRTNSESLRLRSWPGGIASRMTGYSPDSELFAADSERLKSAATWRLCMNGTFLRSWPSASRSVGSSYLACPGCCSRNAGPSSVLAFFFIRCAVGMHMFPTVRHEVIRLPWRERL